MKSDILRLTAQSICVFGGLLISFGCFWQGANIEGVLWLILVQLYSMEQWS